MERAEPATLDAPQAYDLTVLMNGRNIAFDGYVAQHNTQPKPFIWTKSARDILQKVIRANSRLRSRQNRTLH